MLMLFLRTWCACLRGLQPLHIRLEATQTDDSLNTIGQSLTGSR